MKRYVTDIIGDDYKSWKPAERVVISTPTGSGKTTFVIQSLLKHAVQHKKHVIYYCNRRVLNDQFMAHTDKKIEEMVKDLEAVTGIEARQYLHIYTYQSREKSSSLLPREIEDSETGNKIILNPRDILYHVFDEAHYFLSDATLNDRTNLWMDELLSYDSPNSNLRNSILVFLTATPEPLMYFLAWDNKVASYQEQLYNDLNRKRRQKGNLPQIVSEVMDHLSNERKNGNYSLKLPTKKEMETAVLHYSKSVVEPIYANLNDLVQNIHCSLSEYSCEPDYSNVQPIYFLEYENLIAEIQNTKNSKWMIFVDNEDKGKEFQQKLNNIGITDVAFLSRHQIEYNSAARMLYNEIVEDEQFSCRILITTSVLDCGINIHDKKVKNIVIASTDKTSFLQMLGRKRRDDRECIRLFIKVYNFSTIHHRLRKNYEYLEFLNCLSLKNSKKYIKKKTVKEKQLHQKLIAKYPDFDVLDDGNHYGSFLSLPNLKNIVNNLGTMPSWLWYCKKLNYGPSNTIYGHLVPRDLTEENIKTILKEIQYSKTAFLQIVLQIHNYETAFKNYRSFSDDFSIILDYMQQFVNEYEMLEHNPIGRGSFYRTFPQNSRNLLNNYQECGISDAKPYIQRSMEFFLKEQLAWIGKEYDETCWLGGNKPDQPFSQRDNSLEQECHLKKLSDYLERKALSELLYPSPQIANESWALIQDIPDIPISLQEDYIRHKKSNSPPGKKKLNEYFHAFNLPYSIESEQRSVNGERSTYWYIERKPS